MQEWDDMELLRHYAGQDSEEAFTTLVTRHVNLVYSTALRHVGSSHPAEEITQAVFVILAKKARSLRQGTVLSGWLYHAARLTAANFLRSETQRTRREQEAHMQSILNETETDVWQQINPLLDTAMADLNEQERNAIVLRFFEGRNMRDVGNALGASEDAAKKRVARALEKLRKFFTRRGITLSAAVIAGAVSANSVQAAPVGLAETASAVAFAKGATASVSTLTLIKGALKIMAWSKTKTAVAAGLAAVLGVSTAVVVVKVIYFPAIKDVYFQPNYQRFQNLPRGLFVLRPTHFSTPVNGLDYSGETSSPSGEHVTLTMGRTGRLSSSSPRLMEAADPTPCFQPGHRRIILIIFAPS